MLAIRRAGRNDEAAILGLWKQLIQYHRSIEAFRPERWKLPPEEAIRPRLTAGWEHSQTRAAFIAEMEGRVGFCLHATQRIRPLSCQH